MTSWCFLFLAIILHSCAAQRLPTVAYPSAYKVSLVIPESSFTEKGDSFTGKVEIVLALEEASYSIDLHAGRDYLSIATLQVIHDGTALHTTFTVDENDVLTISATQQLLAHTDYKLVVTYDGRLSTTDMNGIYKSSYEDGTGAKKYLVTTQFESIYARRTFPCFDEPSFKATFTIDITVPQKLNAMSNTLFTTSLLPDGTTHYQFETTPKMSTYLIAFVISEFTCSAWNMPEVNSVNKVCSRALKEDTRRWAVEVSPKLLSSLNAYTGIPYTSSMKKVDQVAIPDFRSGAMENWGLITYREAMFLYDPKEDQSIDKQTVARVIAHELAHSWFGNLVTLAWWSEVFLNEGFARYFEHKAVNEVFPDWELGKQFVVATLQSALATDDLQSIQALQSEVITPAQIDAKFKADTSYGKGGSILRMVEHFMGSEQFKSGIQKYLMLNQYSNVEPSNLWAALSINVDNTVSNLPQSLANVMENWITKAGYPLITVTKTSNNVIELKQERFLFSGSDTTTKWYVPVTYTTSVDENKFQKTSTQLWMQPDKDAQIQLPEGASWIILNNQQTGFYRVNYDDTLWAEIEKALKSDSFDDIGELNRAQIVDDLFSLAKANKIPYSKALKVIKFISNDVSYYTWFSANRGFNFLLDKIGFESDLGRAIKDDVLQQLEKVYQSVPPSTIDDTNHLYTLKQTLVVALACRLGHPECIEMTKNHFTAYKNQGTKPPKDLRRIVYCGALRYSADNADWDFLWNAFVKSTSLSEGVIFLSGLGCSKDTDILKRYLLKTVTDSEIRRQDRQTVFVSVVNGNPSNFDTALDFLIEHQKEIDAQYGTMRALPSLLDLVASRITDETQLNKLKNLVTNLDAEHKESGNAALEKAEANLKWKKQVERDLQNYYGIPSDDTDSAVTSTVSLIIVTICSVIDVIGF